MKEETLLHVNRKNVGRIRKYNETRVSGLLKTLSFSLVSTVYHHSVYRMLAFNKIRTVYQLSSTTVFV